MKHINKFETTEEFNKAIGGGGRTLTIKSLCRFNQG